jgi:hypothetical protein
VDWPIFRCIDLMKTQTIEQMTITATALKERAEEQGVTVSQLLAELATLASGPVDRQIVLQVCAPPTPSNIASMASDW